MFTRSTMSALLCSAILLASSSVAATGTSKSSQFFWVSDIHFNPFADPALVDKLVGAPPSDWSRILNESSLSNFSKFGEDTNWQLFRSALRAMQSTVPDPAFTLVTGDLLAHHFREQFDANATVHDDASYLEFVRKTVEFEALELHRVSPKATIIALGNNDADCGDYLIQSDGRFLRDTGPMVARLAGASYESAFSKPWNAFGSFSVAHPVLPRHRVIVLDTSFLSYRHEPGCGGNAVDTGNEMLSWLADELAAAKQHHEKVWLVYHIPPGIDSYATLRHKTAGTAAPAVTFWRSSYAATFEPLLRQDHSTVEASFAGHTHLDDFRLIDIKSRFRSVVIMTPGLSPNIGQNPAFRVVTIDKGKLKNQSTYYLTNLASAGPQLQADWKLEYDFDQAWGMHNLNAASYHKLWRLISQSSEAQNRWMSFYSVSKPGTFITPATFSASHCASGYLSANAFETCVEKEKVHRIVIE